MFIFYLSETGKVEKSLKEIVENLPSYLRLSEDFKNFFSNQKYKLNELTIDKILNIFIFIEHFCFNDLVETLHNEYKEKIFIEKQKEIESKLKISSEDIYTKKDLASAVRRFISNYLAGKLEVADVNENRDLTDEIYREDLWDEEILKKGDLQIEVGEKIREFKLKVGQTYELYKLISKEDKLLIEEYDKIKEEIKEQKMKEQKDEDKEKDKIDEFLTEKDTKNKKPIIKEGMDKNQEEILIKDGKKTLNEDKRKVDRKDDEGKEDEKSLEKEKEK